jgi:hypothetical protein
MILKVINHTLTRKSQTVGGKKMEGVRVRSPVIDKFAGIEILTDADELP